MKFELKTIIPSCDLLVIALHKDEKIPTKTKNLIGGSITKMVENRLASKDFEGLSGQTLILYADEKKSKKLLLIGIGDKKNPEVQCYLNCGAKVASLAKSLKTKEVSMIIDEEKIIDFLNGYVLGSYELKGFKKEDEKNPDPEKLTFIAEKNKVNEEAIKFAEIYERSSKLCRDLINTPAGHRNTNDFARLCKETSKKYEMKCSVFLKKDLEKMGCGAILGVGRGAEYPPNMIVIEYKYQSKLKNPSIAFVGKGITFDTGGLNLKPSGHIETMKLDIAGAATVLSTMQMIAEAKIPGYFVGVMANAENALSARSMHPGDVLTAYNGKTIEILNTDAEGRLVLADALSYTEKNLKPEKMIDIATLTGAVTVALGYHISGLMGSDEKLLKEIENAANSVNERIWTLPMDEDFIRETKGSFTDTKNATDGVRAGTIMGAAFLKQFVDKTPWAHIDTGGTAWVEKPTPTTKYGGTAVMLRTFFELAKRNSK